MHGTMEIIVGYVEEQVAHMNDIFGKEAIKDRREAAFAYLDWEIGLGEEVSHQSHKAQEVKEIYIWWKDIRPKRIDPMDEAGWTEHCEGLEFAAMFNNDKTPEERAHVKIMLDEISRLQQIQEDEDTEMLLRVMKIRKELWT
jgi:hypothetical protein